MVNLQQVSEWTGLRAVEFHYGHIHMMELTDMTKETSRHIPDFPLYIKAQAEGNPSFSLMYKNKLFISFGVVPFWDGFGEAWMVPSKRINTAPVPLVRAGRGFFQHIGTAMGLRRLQFMVHSRHLQAIRFAETLYFKKEATLAKYGPDGSDYYVMTRFYS